MRKFLLAGCMTFLVHGFGCGNSNPTPEAAIDIAPTEQRAVVDTRPNAAREYARIYERLGKGSMDPLVDLSSKAAPNASQNTYLRSKQDIVRDVINAAKIERCDFGTDYVNEPYPVLPHLGQIRTLALLVSHDANRALRETQGSARSAERLVAVIRMAKHGASEPIIIGRLVGLSCLHLAVQSVSDWRQFWGQEEKALLLIELRSVSSSSIFDLKGTIRQEHATAKVAVNSGRDWEGPDGQIIPIAESERGAILSELDRVFPLIEQAIDSPDAPERIRNIIEGARIPKTRLFISGLDSFAKSMLQGKRNLESAIAGLQS